jgi:hypothetical protein
VPLLQQDEQTAYADKHECRSCGAVAGVALVEKKMQGLRIQLDCLIGSLNSEGNSAVIAVQGADYQRENANLNQCIDHEHNQCNEERPEGHG